MKKFEAYNIQYDTDGQEIADLPETVQFEAIDLDDAQCIGADKISDQTGWCVTEFEVREIGGLMSNTRLTNEETATVLAALRYFQQNTSKRQRVEMDQFRFDNIEPLTDDQIDGLCEKINAPEVSNVKRWILDGELDPSKTNLVDVMDDCAMLLNKSYAAEILGEVLFEGDDGKFYVITTEFVVGEANPDYLKDALEIAKEEEE